MKCPEHPEEDLRRESNYDTGFCLKCLKHYDMCTSVKHMEICELLKGHEGPHSGARGSLWVIDESQERGYLHNWKNFDVDGPAPPGLSWFCPCRGTNHYSPEMESDPVYPLCPVCNKDLDRFRKFTFSVEKDEAILG